MRRRRLLPELPDVLGILQEQAAITVEGMDLLAAWANGEPGTVDRLRDCEHRADERKRALREALTTAFLTPLEPEDLFELSRELDRVLNDAKNAVREAELMETEPDEAVAAMAAQLAAGTRDLAAALGRLGSSPRPAATGSADAAAKSQSRLEHVYRGAMSALAEVDDLREVTAKRELYRRLARTSDALREAAERVWYALLKQT